MFNSKALLYLHLLLSLSVFGIAMPMITLPINVGDATQIGTGAFSTISGEGVFNSYDVTDVQLDALIIQYDYTGAPGTWYVELSSVQLFDGITRIDNQWGAASATDFFSVYTPNTWVHVTDPNVWDNGNPFRYLPTNPLRAGNLNEPGGVIGIGSAYYESTDQAAIVSQFYYVGFGSPVNVSSIRLGNGTGVPGLTYNLTFYGYSTPVPEPGSILVLLCLGGILAILRLCGIVRFRFENRAS